MSEATYEHCIHAYACASQLERLRGRLADGETYSILHLVRDLGCGEDCDAYDDTDNLREYVDWLYEHGKMAGIDHGVLLNIADRIDAGYEYRTDDKAEVVLVQEMDALKADNARLRELMRIMHGELVACEDNGYVCGGHKYDDRLRALGIEVD